MHSENLKGQTVKTSSASDLVCNGPKVDIVPTLFASSSEMSHRVGHHTVTVCEDLIHFLQQLATRSCTAWVIVQCKYQTHQATVSELAALQTT